MIGKTFGNYRITGLLGKGGMGEVYLGEDTRLKRKVALKIVRDELSQQPDYALRFEREARLLASLNHPNIASLFGLEECEGTRVLTLELVEGPTLQERIQHGRLPANEAILIARQIAEALEAAHARGIIHRDLKPSNVKVTPAGVVKVLDFGLAKVLEPAAPEENPNQRPTITAMATGEGAVIGTIPYMSPEQIRGEPLDFRTDIWSFGCLLYEMLAGIAAFSRKTPAEVAAAILERDPDWSALPAETPSGAVRLIRRCLQKAPRERMHHIADVRIELDELESGTERSEVATRNGSRAFSRFATVGLAGVLVGALMAWALVASRQLPSSTQQVSDAETVRFTIALPEGQGLSDDVLQEIALSPDGSSLVFAASEGKQSRLYVRRMSEDTSRPIAGTEGAFGPFFSPDGEWIGFFWQDTMRKVLVSGGEPVDICKVGWMNRPGLGAAWGPDGTIVVSSSFDPLLRVSSAGGEVQPVAGLDVPGGEVGQRLPVFLPDGETVLFTSDINISTKRICALDLKSGIRKVLVEEGDSPEYVDGGYLVYNQGGTLFGVAFDVEHVSIQGQPIPLLGGIACGLPSRVAHFALSRSGSLAFIAADDAMPRRSILRLNRQGDAEPLAVEERGYTACRLSSDGRWIAVATWELDDSAIWVSPIDRLALRRLPLQGVVAFPLWHPTESRIVFTAFLNGPADLYTAPADGSRTPVKIENAPPQVLPTSWSPDGRYLVLEQTPPSSTYRIRLLEQPEQTASPEPPTLVDLGFGGTLSPDGQWLAYASYEAGERIEVFVQEFPGGGGRHQVSFLGGLYPAWSPRGDELFYVRGAHFVDTSISKALFPPLLPSMPEFVSVRMTSGPKPVFGKEEVLFSQDLRYGAWGVRYYEVAPDARSFLVPGRDRGNATPRIRVIMNWAKEFGDRISVSP